MRVLFVDHTTIPSGGQLSMFRLVEGLGSRLEPVVVVPADGDLFDTYRSTPGVVVRLLQVKRDTALARGRGLPSLRGAWAVLADMRTVDAHIAAVGAEIVQANSLKTLITAGIPARLRRRKVVCHLHDRLAPDYLGILQLSLARGLVRWIPHAVLANSQTTLDLVPRRRGVRYQVVPSPCTTCIQPPHRLAHRGAEPVQLISLSRLVRWKGQDVVLRAIRELMDRGISGFHLTVYGAALLDDDGFSDELQTLCRELHLDGVVTFAGHVADVEGALRGADVLIHAATVPEPFGQVVVEGMSCGLVVVATDRGGPTEVVDHARTGFLVPPDRPSVLADKLEELIRDPELRHAIGQAAMGAVSPYRPGPIADTVMDVYTAIAAREAVGSMPVSRRRRADRVSK